MIAIVEGARRAARVTEPFQCAVSASDGLTTWAVRYASDGVEPRTLYYSTHRDALCDFEKCETVLPTGATIIASEPLGAVGGAWTRVEPSTLLRVGSDGVETAALAF